MKISRKIEIIAIVSFLLVSTISVYGQEFVPSKVEISTEMVKIEGKVFYVHKVLHGQTLYSISKVYDIPIELLQSNNPDLKDGLKTGTLLYIPVIMKEEVKEEAPTETQENTPIEEPSDKYKKHSVKWYESLSDIAEKYDVTEEQIINLNSLGENPVIKKRQILLIPDKNYLVALHEEQITEPEKDSLTIVLEAFSNESRKELYEHSDRSHLISLLLPFNASPLNNEYSVNMMDFYSGVLMAMKDIQKDGKLSDFQLNVVDISKYPSLSDMFDSNDISNSELIIGPVFEKELEQVAQFAKSNRIPIVSPMDIRTQPLVEDNPYFFLFPTPMSVTLDNIIEEITTAAELDTIAITMVMESGNAQSPIVTKAIDDLQKKHINYQTVSYTILEGRGIDSIFAYTMSPELLNRVYVASDNEAFVSDVMRNLNLVQSVHNYRIDVYGLPRWKSFEMIELDYFHSLDTHLSLQYYIDYKEPKTKEFVKNYWTIFHSEPSPYSFQGYDIATYFISVLAEYGREFPAYITNYKKNLLQSDIHFVPVSKEGGFINDGTRNIVFLKDWEISTW